MGMYDTFYMPDIELPNSRKTEDTYQTKDLFCDMSQYRISGDGRVTKARYTYDDGGDERFEQWAPTDLTGDFILSGTITLQARLVSGRLHSLEII